MIVDNYSYYVVVILAKEKDDYTEKLRIQKKKTELHTKLKFKTIKIDNMYKLIKVRNKQNKNINIKIKPTAPYTLNLNNIVEKGI